MGYRFEQRTRHNRSRYAPLATPYVLSYRSHRVRCGCGLVVLVSIKKVEFTYKKKNLRRDGDLYVGYQVDTRDVNGKRIHPTFATKREAEAFLDAVNQAKTYRKAGAKTPIIGVRCSVLFAKRIKVIRNEKERKRATTIFDNFLDGILLHDPPVQNIRTADFQKYINARSDGGLINKTQKVKPQTIDREMTVLSTVFRDAPKMFPDELEGYECVKIPRPGYTRKKRHRHEITAKEKDVIIHSILNQRLRKEKEVRTKSRAAVADIFHIGWLLGLRWGEAAGLQKTDLKDRTLRAVRFKTEDVTLFEDLPDFIVEILQRNIERSETRFIFHLHCSDHTVAAIIKDACEDNGIIYGRSELDGVTFHSTRHAFTSRLVRVTNLPTAQSFTSHSSPIMVDYYSHTNSEERKKAMQKMYGDDSEKLTKIYEKIVAGEITLEQFLSQFGG